MIPCSKIESDSSLIFSSLNPCLIRKFNDEENMLIAIIENMQREDLNPIEEAEGLNICTLHFFYRSLLWFSRSLHQLLNLTNRQSIFYLENMQREDLNPIEEAEGLNQMIKTYGLTQEEVSKSVSKSRPYITNALRLLKLPPQIQDLVTEGKISTGHGKMPLASRGISLMFHVKQIL